MSLSALTAIDPLVASPPSLRRACDACWNLDPSLPNSNHPSFPGTFPCDVIIARKLVILPVPGIEAFRVSPSCGVNSNSLCFTLLSPQSLFFTAVCSLYLEYLPSPFIDLSSTTAVYLCKAHFPVTCSLASAKACAHPATALLRGERRTQTHDGTSAPVTRLCLSVSIAPACLCS